MKKCEPTTLSPPFTPLVISPSGRLEEFVARIASVGARRPSSPNSPCFSARSSGAASITNPADSTASARSVVVETRPREFPRTSSDRSPLRSRSASDSSIRPTALSRACSDTS